MPVTFSGALSVILPVVVVAVRLPFTVPCNARAVAFTMVALPLVPLVLSVTAPVAASVSRLISALFCLVVKLLAPVTVNVPLSVRLPVVAVAVRSPFTVPCNARAVAFTIVAFPLVPVVLSVTAPVAARVPRSISASASDVAKLLVPVTVNVLLSVRLPVVAVAERFPFTVPLKARAVALTTFAFPDVPEVFSVTAPVDASVSSSMSASACEVVKLLVPVTASVPLSVRLPVVAVAIRFPFTVPCSARAVAFTIVALPLVPVVLSVTAPVEASVSKLISALLARVVRLVVPATVIKALSVRLPVVARAVRLPPTVP